MKLLFLDFDGVIISTKSMQERTKRKDFVFRSFPHKRYVSLLNEIDRVVRVFTTEQMSIVISSQWRLYDGVDVLKLVLCHYGLHKNIPVYTIPRYPAVYNPPYKLRGFEIKKYLEDLKRLFDITGYAILDDEGCQFLPEQQSHCVITSMYEGLTKEDAYSAASIMLNMFVTK